MLWIHYHTNLVRRKYAGKLTFYFKIYTSHIKLSWRCMLVNVYKILVVDIPWKDPTAANGDLIDQKWFLGERNFQTSLFTKHLVFLCFESFMLANILKIPVRNRLLIREDNLWFSLLTKIFTGIFFPN